MQTTSCNSCGQPIVWVKKRDNGKWNRPLDALSSINGLVVVDDEVHMGTLYQIHQCAPNDVSRLINQKRLEDASKAEQEEHHGPLVISTVSTAADEEREIRQAKAKSIHDTYGVRVQAWENPDTVEARLIRAEQRHMDVAEVRRCPYCKAKKGELCWNVSEKLRGNDIKSRAPHPERTGDIPKEEYRTPKL